MGSQRNRGGEARTEWARETGGVGGQVEDMPYNVGNRRSLLLVVYPFDLLFALMSKYGTTSYQDRVAMLECGEILFFFLDKTPAEVEFINQNVLL